MEKSLREKLGKQLLFFDGAMGTELQNRGLLAGELPELWNCTHEQEILDIHAGYLACGCDIILANTFGANCFKLKESGHSVSEIVQKGVEIAQKAAAMAGRG